MDCTVYVAKNKGACQLLGHRDLRENQVFSKSCSFTIIFTIVKLTMFKLTILIISNFYLKHR